MNNERIVKPEIEDVGEEKLESTLRPQTLDEYIGQDKVKENLNVYVADIKRLNTLILFIMKCVRCVIGKVIPYRMKIMNIRAAPIEFA